MSMNTKKRLRTKVDYDRLLEALADDSIKPTLLNEWKPPSSRIQRLMAALADDSVKPTFVKK